VQQVGDELERRDRHCGGCQPASNRSANALWRHRHAATDSGSSHAAPRAAITTEEYMTAAQGRHGGLGRARAHAPARTNTHHPESNFGPNGETWPKTPVGAVWARWP
jgi:hypothetical protein